ncbi:hypothetical protein C8R47DRAFT_1315308, partial [Mycena vitilis]
MCGKIHQLIHQPIGISLSMLPSLCKQCHVSPQPPMPCAGKDGAGCPCKVFEHDTAQSEPSSKCKLCKHRKKYHTMPSGGVSDVLAKFDLARLQSKKASDEEARLETSKGFRGGKSDTGKGTRTSKSGSSKAAAANTLIKVGSLQVITAGVNGEGKPRDDKCPNGPDVEDMADRGLAASKSPDGEDLEFDLNWGFADIDAWMRAMLKPKLGFGVFDLLDTRYGGAPDRESDSHWVLVAKHNRKIYVKRGPVDGELLNSVKGSASGHRKYKEHAIRILTRHRIPFVLTQDWDVAVGRAMEEEVLKSESEAESTAKVKGGKGKARAKAKPRSVSSESSEAESSDSDPEVVAKDDVTGPPRRSSRFKDRAVVKTEELDVDPADIVPRSPSSHSGHSVPLLNLRSNQRSKRSRVQTKMMDPANVVFRRLSTLLSMKRELSVLDLRHTMLFMTRTGMAMKKTMSMPTRCLRSSNPLPTRHWQGSDRPLSLSLAFVRAFRCPNPPRISGATTKQF